MALEGVTIRSKAEAETRIRQEGICRTRGKEGEKRTTTFLNATTTEEVAAPLEARSDIDG